MSRRVTFPTAHLDQPALILRSLTQAQGTVCHGHSRAQPLTVTVEVVGTGVMDMKAEVSTSSTVSAAS